MNVSPTYATGVVASLTMTKIARPRLKAKAPSNSKTNSLGLRFGHPPFIASRKKVVSIPGFFAKKRTGNPV